jgi:hypothetical protein
MKSNQTPQFHCVQPEREVKWHPTLGIASVGLVAMLTSLPIGARSFLSSASASSARYQVQRATKPTSSRRLPAKTSANKANAINTGSNGTILLTISMVDLLKSSVVISVPAGTKAKKIPDSTATVLTFPDGAQMSVEPDASVFGDYKKNIVSFEDLTKAPLKDRTVFLLDKSDRLIYSDNMGAELSKRTVFVMQKKLPDLVLNRALAIGVLCSDTGLHEETVAPNRASIDTMMAACDSIVAGK